MAFIELGTLKLWYDIHGHGPRVVFIPGTASDLRQQLNIFVSPLIEHFEVLSFDPCGIGQANSPDAAPTMIGERVPIWCASNCGSRHDFSRRERSPMTEKTAKSVHNLGYHAHIYYDPTSTRAVAEGVCAALEEHFQVEIDGFRDTPIGPHPIANVLVLFKPDQFAHVVPYLMVHRAGLDVLVHPLTEDAVEDHTDFAMWLGQPVALKLHTLPHGRGGRLPSGVSA